MNQAKLIIEVTAGLLAGRPDPEHTRQYALTSERWHEAGENGGQAAALAELNGQATGYAALLMMQPDSLNWVNVSWIWL
jgi:hypothetical protein